MQKKIKTASYGVQFLKYLAPRVMGSRATK